MIGNTATRRPGDGLSATRTLCVGVNWIGDTVMSLPALQAWRLAAPEAHLSVLVKRALAPLWELHAAPDQILTYEESPVGTFAAGKMLRAGRFDRAYVMPNSFRSALIPFLGRIAERVGTPGHQRGFLLTRTIAPVVVPGREHQAYEYFDLLGLPPPSALAAPRLHVSEGARERALTRLASLSHPLVGLIPGAARGPSKRWPAEHFVEAGRRLQQEHGCGLVLFGGAADVELCAQIASALGPQVLDLAGKTTLKDWVALLACCQLVICNDSGGMHLAAAVGTPLVALYGQTDPARTGPVGGRCVVLQDSTERSRDIARDSEAARRSLAAITPARVVEVAGGLLKGSTG